VLWLLHLRFHSISSETSTIHHRRDCDYAASGMKNINCG
jgi:hypothetical protein